VDPPVPPTIPREWADETVALLILVRFPRGGHGGQGFCEGLGGAICPRSRFRYSQCTRRALRWPRSIFFNAFCHFSSTLHAEPAHDARDACEHVHVDTPLAGKCSFRPAWQYSVVLHAPICAYTINYVCDHCVGELSCIVSSANTIQ
jgi:hypothetical protein